MQVPASGEIIQNEIIHRALCEISRLSFLKLFYHRDLNILHKDIP